MKNRFLFLVVTAVCVSSCTAYRAARQSKKDAKLYKEVIANDRVLPKAANVYNLLHPIEQKIIYIKGKDYMRVDSIPYDVVRDSIIKVECPSINFDSLKKAWTKIIYHNSTDTIVFPDTTCWRRVDIINDQYLQLKGKYDQQTIELAATKKSTNKWLWLFIAACAFIVIENGLLLYNFLRPKVKV